MSKTAIGKPTSGPALTQQKRINAYNFPFTCNPTINCLYGCRYCYLAKFPFSQHGRLGEEMFYKTGFIPKLRQELAKWRKLPQHLRRVQIGPACEIYHPFVAKQIGNTETPEAQKDIGLMRNVLQAFIDEQAQHQSVWAIHIVTKSNLIEDDLDLLKQLDCVQAEITITTLDEDVKHTWEGTSPSVKVRLQTVERLSAAGVFTRVMAMPLFVKPAAIKALDAQHGSTTAAYHDALVRERWKMADEIWSEGQKRGAQAFKGKGLNYFDPVDLEADEKIVVKGRNEDPNKEKLIHSGEVAYDSGGNILKRKAKTWEVRPTLNADGTPAKTKNGKPKKAIKGFSASRAVMDFGYGLMPRAKHLDWGDCC